MSRFILRLCHDLPDSDDGAIERIGVDPLWVLVHEWPDATLAAIEVETEPHPTLLRALSIVIAPTELAQQRIDAIVARHRGFD